MVAELSVDAELTDDELGVLESSTSVSSDASWGVCTELSMHSRGLVGLPDVADCVFSGSYPFAKVLIAVGDTADSVSNRRLDPLPNVLACEVLRESLGRDWRGSGVGSDCWVRNGGVTIIVEAILFEARSWWCVYDWANIVWCSAAGLIRVCDGRETDR